MTALAYWFLLLYLGGLYLTYVEGYGPHDDLDGL